MNILIISQYYPPEPPMRPSDLAVSLTQRGHKVTVITGFPCYPAGQIYDGYPKFGFACGNIDGIRVVRMPTFADHSDSKLRRTLYYGSIASGAMFVAPLIGGRFDVAFVFSPPITLGLPTILTKWLYDLPFVFDVQDLYPESLTATGLVNSSAIINGLRRLALLNYRCSAAITVISPGFKRNIVDKGIPADKIHIIPNWVDEELYKPAPKNMTLGRDLGMEGRFNVVYGGNMGIPQRLESVLEAAERLQDIKDLQFLFVGSGVEEAKLKGILLRKKLSNVRFIGRKNQAEMRDIYSLSDCLLVHLSKDPLFEITIPSKTIAYLASGRPIIAAMNGDVKDIIENSRAGLTCPPENPARLAETIRLFHSLTENAREKMGQNARDTFLANYSRRSLVDRFEQLFFRIAGQRR
jgi:colanic acid biosynthesis glycosyl transferase WcaI